jgi:glycosyltransferase involved in cell wall biosynthesis
MFMSRIDYKKGLDALMPALAQLRREFGSLWFVLAGSGDPSFMPSVDRWIGEQGLSTVTSKVGFLSGQDKADALAAAGIFALPSLNENFGIVLIEAMHAGVPLLISDEVYIHREIAGHGAGLVCRPEAASIAGSLRRMLDGSVDLAKMGRCGRDLVERRYRPEAATELLLGAYSAAIEAAPRRKGAQAQ